MTLVSTHELDSKLLDKAKSRKPEPCEKSPLKSKISFFCKISKSFIFVFSCKKQFVS